MKQRTRILALTMTLVMIFNCLGGMTAFGVSADGQASGFNPSDPTANGWIGLTTANISDHTFASGGFYYFENDDSKYYLAEDLNMDHTLYVYAGWTTTIDLNGYDWSMNSAKEKTVVNLKADATLNLYDCGTALRYWDINGENIGVISADGASSCDFTTAGGAITGGVANAVGGGGVFIQGGATFNMYGGNIVGNQCASGDDRQGGGVYNYSGTFNLYGGTIQGNASNKTIAGGVYNRVGSTFNMYGGTIANNYSITYGGGLYNVGTFNMEGGTIEYNTAGLGGGGVSTTGVVNLSGGSIQYNTGTYRCGGVFIASNGTLNMSGGSITGNHSGNGGEAGVGIVYATSILNVTGGAITGNTTTGASAGVGYTNGVFTLSGAAEITDNYVVDGSGAEIAQSNAYLSNGNVIAVDAVFTGEVGVGTTLATGTGSVATGSHASVGIFTSDTGYYMVKVGDTITLQSAVDTDGTNQTSIYSASSYDLTQMFSQETSETTYSIIGGTGSGSISDGDLTVDKIGTFIVKADTPYSATNAPSVETATLTVTAKTVNVTGITAVGTVVGAYAELDNTSGSIDGAVSGDDVSIDFAVAYGVIESAVTEDDVTTNTVSIHDIALTGDHAGNYELGTVNNGNGTTFVTNIATPYISWPTAKDITYGDDRVDGNLVGGQAMVKYGADWFDITDKGHFVWGSNDAINATGTHTYEVRFAFNDDIKGSDDKDEAGDDFVVADYEKYVAAVESATHNVTQLVHAKEVTFTVTDNVQSLASNTLPTIATTDANRADYSVVYTTYDTENGGYKVVSDPYAQGAGTYFISVYFTINAAGETVTNPNYIHAGTMESAGKQIGAFVIYEDADTTERYTVNFSDYSPQITGVIGQTIHVLPTLDESLYSAWQTNSSGATVVYDFGARFPQPAYNVTFTPVAALATGTISGTITGANLDGTAGDLRGVVVALMQGAEQIAMTKTDSNGDYSFVSVPQGRYNLVVTRDYIIRNEETVYINLASDALTVDDIALPDTRQNTIFNVAAGMTAITVEGMKALITDEEVRSIKVELSTAAVADTQVILAAAAAENGLGADNCKYFIDLRIQERASDATGYREINALDEGELLTFYIPLAGIYQGYDNYIVYQDNGSITALGDTPNSAGECMTVEDGLLTLTVQTSGIYGLAFYNNPDQVVDGGTATTAYTTEVINTNELFATIPSDGARTYVITGGTGEGTIDNSGYLTVTKVGTFEITVNVASTATYASVKGTGVLTVTQKAVTISGVTTVDRGVEDGSLYVDINAGGRVSGVEDGDQVYIDFDNGYGVITDSNFTEDAILNETGENSFAVSVKSLSLTGADATNYTLVGAVTSQVTVKMSIPYIAWPTATNVVYGNSNSHDDLYGGKVVVFETISMGLDEYGEEVVVYEGGAYTDITSYGAFQWVQLATEANAGTYEYAVKFVEDTNASTYDGEATYRATLDSTTQMVTQVVEPAAVTFTIADTTLEVGETPVITATDENGTVLDPSLYTVYYATDNVWDWTGTEADFTVTGTYLVGAELLSANYRHAGDTVITAKQIGAVTIYTGAEPTTYSTTFMVGDSEYAVFDGALAETIHVLPDLNAELDTDSYTGWVNEGTGAIHKFGTRFTQGSENVTFTAMAAEDKNATISGVITGADVGSGLVGPLSGIGVALYQGNTLIGTYTTDANGTYTFAVASGVYNLVVTRTYNDTAYEITVFVDVTEGNSVRDFVLSTDLVQNAILEVDKGMPELAVEGLTDLATTKGGNENIEVKLTVSSSTQSDLDDIGLVQEKAAENGLTKDDIKKFFNIDLGYMKDGDMAYTAITELDDCLSFYIPLTGDYQGHDAYYVYRYHQGQVQELTMEPVDGEYFEVTDEYLIMHAKYFSLYGVGFVDYTVTTPSAPSSYSSVMSATVNGSASLSASKSTINSKVTISTDPDTGYKVGAVTVTYASGREVTVTDNGDGTYCYLQPGAAVTVTVTFVAVDGGAAGESTSEDDWIFTDVDEDDWYYDGIQWAVEEGITTGATTTTFDPYGITNRAQAVTFLWRSVGEPDHSADNEFIDVALGAYYYDSVLWAGEHDITLGTTTTTYSPYVDCSRAHIITFLWRLAGKPVVDSENPFTDVSTANYYYNAVLWAVDKGITKGTTDTTFSPDKDCTRLEIITFLYRELEG